MSSRIRNRRFARTAEFVRRPRNYYAWAFWCGLLLFLLGAFTDMILCGIEEDLKPAEICGYCEWRAKNPNRIRPGCGGEYGPPNRYCPECKREWGAFHPYYLKWFRDPIRDQFGRLHF
jgi:hypothetical protein